MPASAPLIAVVNTDVYVTELLEKILHISGFTTISKQILHTAAGHQGVAHFLQEHQPRAVIYHLMWPYAESWDDFDRNVLRPHVLPDHRFILLTTDKRQIEALARGTPAITILSRPFDLHELLKVVQHAVEGPTGG